MFVGLDKIPKLQLLSHALNCCGQNYNFELNLDLRLAYKTCNGQNRILYIFIMKILTVLCPVHQSIHLLRTDHILLATRVKILRADRAAAKKKSQIPF